MAIFRGSQPPQTLNLTRDILLRTLMSSFSIIGDYGKQLCQISKAKPRYTLHNLLGSPKEALIIKINGFSNETIHHRKVWVYWDKWYPWAKGCHFLGTILPQLIGQLKCTVVNQTGCLLNKYLIQNKHKFSSQRTTSESKTYKSTLLWWFFFISKVFLYTTRHIH